MAAGCAGVSSSKLGIAFACTIAAAFASVLGALLMIIVPVKNTLFLAASLAFASGVMLYISFVDIYAGKSVDHFKEAGYNSAYAFTYASICFFCGFPISYVLDKIAARVVYPGSDQKTAPPPVCVCTAPPPPSGKPRRQGTSSNETPWSLSTEPSPTLSSAAVDAEMGLPSTAEGSESDGAPKPSIALMVEDPKLEEERKQTALKLVHMGLLAALAMAFHNMPEGLVTFVGYMDSIYSGITTGIAIAIHNIPEGMVVASAVYFGTGKRLKAVMWALISALAEPVGGIIGLAVVCGGSMTPTVFGILFGLVSGIMVYISIKELLPSARSFDPDDKVTTSFLTAGMIIMACSLVAIAFSQPMDEPVEEFLDASLPPMLPPMLPPALPPVPQPPATR